MSDVNQGPETPQPQYPPPPAYPPPPPDGPTPPPPAGPTPPVGPDPSAPAPTPVQAPAPQPQTPSGAAGAPTAPKKGRTGVWVGLGVGCLVLVLLAICGLVASYFIFGGGGGKSERKAAFDRAEQHYTQATASLAALEAASSKLRGSGNPEAMSKEFDASVAPVIEEASGKLTAARREVEPLESSAARTAYLGSLDAAEESLRQMSALSKELENIGELSTSVDKIASLTKSAGTTLDKALKSANNGNWNAGIAQGGKAEAQYAAAEKLARAANKDYPNLGFEDLVKEIALRRKASGLIVTACRAAKKGSRGAYSNAIDSFNATAGKTGKSSTPEFVKDPNLLLEKFTESYDKLLKQLSAADSQHAAALEAIKSGDY